VFGYFYIQQGAIMANIMIREQEGVLTAYIAKKDLEAAITSLEFDEADRWGGKITLDNGSSFYFEPLSSPPSLPITIRMRRA
jgi:nitrogen fixation protein NifT